MSIDEILTVLRRNPDFMQDVVAWRREPPRPARFADPPAGLDDDLVAWLRQRGTWPLFTHQTQAIQAALKGEHVVIVTGTASGKTLCYNLPVLQMLRHDPSAAALYLFPTKALAQDQVVGLQALLDGVGAAIPCHIYDGDTPSSRRPAVRKAGGVILSNPDMLHAGILPHHTRWTRLLSNLRVVVLDEVHTYRGVFGSHLANVIRRLRRICRFYGSDPCFICTSATIANPAEHVQRLIEAPVTLVDEDGSPRGERHFILYNPPLLNPALGIRRHASGVSVKIAAEFLQANIQTLLFARSRLATEGLLTALRSALSPQLLPADRLQAYRGGYLPRERRRIEEQIRSGRVRGVVATNALELGIDIGDLSACILVGYPGTIASTRQQAGRAGRRLETAAALMVAEPNPLDQYIVSHPRFLFERNPERALINPDNLVILFDHLKCAAYELRFEAGERFGAIDDVEEMLAFLCEIGYLHQSGQSYHWIADEYPAATISLRSGSSESVVIQDVSAPERPTVIGQIELESAPVLLHQGAIYPHAGQDYLVERLDWDGRRADVRPVAVEYVTRATTSTSLQVLEVVESRPLGPLVKSHGLVRVTRQATAYRKLKRSTFEMLGSGEIDLPPQSLETTAYWFALTPELTARLEAAGVLPAAINYGPNWSEQKERARTRDGGRCQQCGVRERPSRHHDVHHLRPFRSFNYLPGVNENYRPANALENLVTLCPACHRRAEQAVRMRSALAGLSSLLRNLAPLFLMCAPADIFVVADTEVGPADGPTVTIYERSPAGVGFSQQLFQLHAELLTAARERIRDCVCLDGCPACVGPPGEVGPQTKEATLVLLDVVLD